MKKKKVVCESTVTRHAHVVCLCVCGVRDVGGINHSHQSADADFVRTPRTRHAAAASWSEKKVFGNGQNKTEKVVGLVATY